MTYNNQHDITFDCSGGKKIYKFYFNAVKKEFKNSMVSLAKFRTNLTKEGIV